MEVPDQRSIAEGARSDVSPAFNNDGPRFGPRGPRRRFVLCFDGTGNKFRGDAGDSNILKIYSLLDKTDVSEFHYYQPGIGTYTTRASLSSNGTISRIASWYNKAKDSAVGTTLDEHVMAGYKFLMRYYQSGDDIYFFGFSRGSYIARFLAEMLDHVGLLSQGNEELVRFVWKTFAQWQARQGGKSEEEKKKAADILHFMTAFRETFSRPVRRIRFLGLFDTVNSCPKFETAWMQRSHKFPYTARSSALVIRHAVSIDERRAKFRQDLVSQKKERHTTNRVETDRTLVNGPDGMALNRAQSHKNLEADIARFKKAAGSKPSPFPGGRDRFRSRSRGRNTRANQRERPYTPSNASLYDDSDGCGSDDEEIPQDVEEVWFLGQHGDVGGGWLVDNPEKLALSHVPLVWMVREAQRAGLVLLPDKLQELNCLYYEDMRPPPITIPTVPQIEVNDNLLPEMNDEILPHLSMSKRHLDGQKKFLDVLEASATRAPLHDCLSYGHGLSWHSVLPWRLMEYLPFRRMDLQQDGTWKAIRWPLPMGEVRDVPYDVKIHNSVIKRMQADPEYRPGNLIVGGGGRGVRVAPKELGMGEWVILREKGHPIGEIWVRKKRTDKMTMNETHKIG